MVLVASPEAHKEVLMTHCYEFKKPDIMYRFVVPGVSCVFFFGFLFFLLR